MPHRLEKINELIKRELGRILLEEGNFSPGVLVTILAVRTGADLEEAAVTFSVLPANQCSKILANLENRIFFLQQCLNKKLRMRPVPKIRFVLDETEGESQKVETLLEKLRQENL